MMLKKVVNKILNVVGAIFISCFLVLVVFCFVGVRPYIVLSGSMEPTIQTGSLAFVNSKASFDEVRKGDIVAFQIDTGATVTHRVISVTDQGIETKGDNNDVSDGITTTKDNFKGENMFSIPCLGYAFSFVQSKRGMILSITGVIFFILLEIATSESKEEKERAETSDDPYEEKILEEFF